TSPASGRYRGKSCARCKETSNGHRRSSSVQPGCRSLRVHAGTVSGMVDVHRRARALVCGHLGDASSPSRPETFRAERRCAMSPLVTSRRLLLGAALTLPFAGSALAKNMTGSLTPKQRQLTAFENRRDAARAQFERAASAHARNGDEDRYYDRRASFSKTMPHND